MSAEAFVPAPVAPAVAPSPPKVPASFANPRVDPRWVRWTLTAATLLVVAPWVLNFNNGDTGLTVFYLVAGIAVLAVSLITNYQYSPKREWAGATATSTAAPHPA